MSSVSSKQRWTVTGGADKGGILVRKGQELSSPATEERLATGAEVEQLSLTGGRLQYRLISGTGPEEGWVSLSISGKDLLAKKASEQALSLPIATKGAVGPGSGFRHRWAIDIDKWMPDGEFDGAEFQFLLSLIREEDDRKAVTRFKFFDDKKRALVSRLLVRQASASSLNMTNFTRITIKRTKGKKPFLAEPLASEDQAPNWNVNCSHEGSWVVCASEPLCVAGIDVAELRRHKKNGEPIDFHQVFKDNLTPKEWDYVRLHGPDLDTEYEAFSRFWSAKEAFVKARGDGLAFPLGDAEFHWEPAKDLPRLSAYIGKVHVKGEHRPEWKFIQHKMPSETPHWTTVGRGPLTDIIDAAGEFFKTLRKKQSSFTNEEWNSCLDDESPHFDVLPLGALVPQDDMDDFVKAGGRRFP